MPRLTCVTNNFELPIFHSPPSAVAIRQPATPRRAAVLPFILTRFSYDAYLRQRYYAIGRQAATIML